MLGEVGGMWGAPPLGIVRPLSPDAPPACGQGEAGASASSLCEDWSPPSFKGALLCPVRCH